jgi:DNA-binding beta-propeller fold protein YncE
MRMKSRWVLAGLIGVAAVLLNSCTNSNGTGPNSGTGFMWVVTQGDQKVNSYNISLSSGAVGQVGTSQPTGLGPIAIALTPAGDALFVANRDDNTISYYKVNSDGSLPVPCPSPQPANCNTVVAGPVAGTPVALAVDPSGKFLFVANQASQGVFPPPNTPDTVAVFSIQSGVLSPVGSFLSTGNGPSALAASPTGNFLYVANRFTSTVSILSYDANGTLTQDATSPVTVGANPAGLSFSRCLGTTTATTTCPTAAPPGYLFVANSGSNDITILSACTQVTTACPSADGTLTPIAGSPVSSSGTGPVSFIVDPVLDFVYAVNNGSFQVSQYRYSPATGLLTLLSPPTISTGSSPLTGAITSDGHRVFVPNSGGSSVFAYTLNPSTQTTPTGQLAVGTGINLLGQPSAVLIR